MESFCFLKPKSGWPSCCFAGKKPHSLTQAIPDTTAELPKKKAEKKRRDLDL
jgi:hypothetical protein